MVERLKDLRLTGCVAPYPPFERVSLEEEKDRALGRLFILLTEKKDVSDAIVRVRELYSALEGNRIEDAEDIGNGNEGLAEA